MTTTDDMTVAEIRDDVEEIDDVELLESMLNSEERGKDRKTAREAIEDRIGEVTEATVEVEEVDADDGDDESDRHNPHGEFVKVRPAEAGGHIAGYSFGDGEVKEIKLDGKVQRSLSRGELQLIR